MGRPSRANAGANRDRPRQLPTSGPVLRQELSRSAPAFQTITIDGGDDMLARDYRTLTLAAGSGVTIATDKPAGVVTISAEAGAVAVSRETLTAPYNSREWSQTVSVPGVTPSTRVVATWGMHAETAENNPEADGLRVRAVPGLGQITFTIYGSTGFGGPFVVHYLTS